MQVNLFIWDALTGFPASYNTLIEGDAVVILCDIVRLRALNFLIFLYLCRSDNNFYVGHMPSNSLGIKSCLAAS